MMGVSSVLLSSVLASSVLMHPAMLESTIRPATNSGLTALLFVMAFRLDNNYLTYVNNYILQNYYYTDCYRKGMSQIITFSADAEFAQRLDSMTKETGYNNRSRFLRDAALNYNEQITSGDLENMDEGDIAEGTMVIYFQHESGKHLEKYRHIGEVNVHSYQHSCLSFSHSCVDTMQLNGKVSFIKDMIKGIRQTDGVDKVQFIISPMRDHGCC